MKKCCSFIIALAMMISTVFMPLDSAFATTGGNADESLVDIVLLDADVQLHKSEYEHTGEQIMPEFTVKHDSEVLVENVDYTVSYTDNVNVGNAKVIVKGIGNYTGIIEKEFSIIQNDFSEAKLIVSENNCVFTGKPLTPEVSVEYKGKMISKDDYDVEYSNNIFPGSAKITVKGKNAYSALSLSGDFYISKITSLMNIKRGETSVQLKWSEMKNVTGYIIYRKNSDGTYKWLKTIADNKTDSTVISNLASGRFYTFRVRSYVKKGGKVYYGTPRLLTTFTRPGQVSISRVSTSPKLMVVVGWYKKECSGYQVMISRSSDFKRYDLHTVDSADASSKLIKYLRDNSNYYVKVRAYKKYKGITSYGSWSRYKKFRSYDTGWMTVNGNRCYLKNTKIVHGYYTINGDQYYFDRSTGECHGVSWNMWDRVRNSTSKTGYLIAVSKTRHRLCVFRGSKGDWDLYKYMKCTTGARSTPTPSGSYLVPKTNTYQTVFGRSGGYAAWYSTKITGPYLIHSVLYQVGSKTKFLDGRLGQSLSHGCIRVSLSNAKWVQDNIRPGTRVIIY